MSNYHSPVLLHDCINGLRINSDGVYVDVTFGGGGHSLEIIKSLKGGKLFAFDQDADAAKNQIQDKRFHLIPQNFRFLRNHLRINGVSEVDGILADLGVSSHQFDTPIRGFSFRFDAELDMRMDQRAPFSAKNLINEYAEEKLAEIFWVYGEIKNSRKTAAAIVVKRQESPINTIFQLKAVVDEFVDKRKPSQFYAQLFQAIRIEVNGELDALKEMLTQAGHVLKQGGRLVVISYHSLEDRLVKNFMKSGNFVGEIEQDFFGNRLKPFKTINNKVIVPAQNELDSNNRARSAKLRIAEKL